MYMKLHITPKKVYKKYEGNLILMEISHKYFCSYSNYFFKTYCVCFQALINKLINMSTVNEKQFIISTLDFIPVSSLT